ncbi:MAG: VWA domain-containing protein [Streptosporangiales bacterium]|nr:VWA domain-containing protein [Streptosporangiales bacterium]
MPSGRHRLESLREPRGVGPLIALAAAVLSVLLIATWVAITRGIGCGDPVYLNVSASPDIAPVLQRAAIDFNSTHRHYSGTCVLAQVNEQESAAVATELSGGRGSIDRIVPDVWVPETSAWPDLVRKSSAGGRRISREAISVARSPVVLAATRSYAEDVRDPEWDMILPDPDRERAVQVVDPNRGGAGMAALLVARSKIGEEDDAELTEFVRGLQPGTVPGQVDLYSAYAGPEEDRPIVITSEQAVWSYNRRRPEDTATALYPQDGTVALDYPYVRTTDDPVKTSAVDDFYTSLRAAEQQAQLLAEGFRTSDGAAGAQLRDSPGITSGAPHLRDAPTGDEVLMALDDWNRLAMPTRTLVLADTSESVTRPIGSGPTTRLEVAKEAARLGLPLFPKETEMGLWLFAERIEGSQDYREAVPLGRLDARLDDDTRRARLDEVTGGITSSGGASSLYDSLLAAYRRMSRDFRPGKINSVLVLTTGVDEDRTGISLDRLVSELRKEFDPGRPVTVIVLAFQADADREALRRIAEATSGSVYVTTDPDEIGDIFLNAISRRLCVPNCRS